MQKHIMERVFESAYYLLQHKSTIRETAKAVGVSKSTTHIDLQDRLQAIDPMLHSQVVDVLEWNLSERHIRGGEATKKYYKNSIISKF